ncbi:MAG: hypothetical protein FK734_10785 [Asgard group archaeon]|nr:hypothetical protein [Asgard group archaeon]
MKCCYDPEIESEGNCVQCNVPLCKTCLGNAQLEEGLCQACLRQKKMLKIYQIFRISVCALGVGWLVIAFIIISDTFWDKLIYGSLGLMGAFAINMLTFYLLSRMLLSNLQSHQKVFVALARYSVTGNKVFFTQAIKAMKKVDDMTPYRDALFDQLVSILILQPYDLPTDWVEYLCENFKLTEKELLDGLLEYGTDVFEENIFNQHFYQAIEPYIEILNRTKKYDIYNKLMDQLMERLEKVDLKAATRPTPMAVPGQQEYQQRDPPNVVHDKAFLTELKLIDAELEEFLIKHKRGDDWKKIDEVISAYDLPKVPKSTFDAAKMLAMQQQQQLKGPDGIAGTSDDLGDPNKVKICAECGITFNKDEMSSYVFRNIKVNVCSECLAKLEKDGHREPRLLAQILRPGEEHQEVLEKKPGKKSAKKEE